MPRVKTRLVRETGPPPLLELCIRNAARRLNRLPDDCIATLQALPFELAERIMAALVEKKVRRAARPREAFSAAARGAGDLSAINFFVTIGVPVESLELRRFSKTDRIFFENLARSPVSSSIRRISFPMDAEDAELELVAAVCPNLERIDVSSCLSMTLGGIVRALRARPGVTELLAFNSAQVSAADAEFDAGAFSGLEALSLGSGSRLHDDALAAIARSCPRLERLLLRECWRLSDASLAALAEHCPRLALLALSDAREVTDFGLAKLARRCPRLAELELKSLPQVTDLFLSRAAACLPGLAALHLEHLPKAPPPRRAPPPRALRGRGAAARGPGGCAGGLPAPCLAALAELRLSSLHTSDAALCALAARCPLVRLSLIGCTVKRAPDRPHIARALRAARGAGLEVETDGSLPEVVDFACSWGD
eukprot:tig00000828_g4633.t1